MQGETGEGFPLLGRVNKTKHNMITQNNTMQHREYRLTTEASMIGLPPGQPIPKSLETNLGTKLPFLLQHASEEVWTYKQALGCLTLLVFNT